MRHQITIDSDQPGRYSVAGAVSIPSTPTPIQDAAAAIRAAGAQDSDSIVAQCGECSILPATIGAILTPRKPPRSFQADY